MAIRTEKYKARALDRVYLILYKCVTPKVKYYDSTQCTNYYYYWFFVNK